MLVVMPVSNFALFCNQNMCVFFITYLSNEHNKLKKFNFLNFFTLLY